MKLGSRCLILGGLAAALIAAGCTTTNETSGSSTTSGGSGGSGGGGPALVETIDLQVDTNRDGWVDESDNEGEDVWTSTRGAAFLPNLDDDDGDGIRDADDDIVNNEADLLDVAPVVVKAWPDAPDGAVAAVIVDGAALPYVRLFLMDAPTPTFAGAGGGDRIVLTTEQLRSGVQLGIEGLTLAGIQSTGMWDGLVTLTLAVTDDGGAPITTDTNPDGTDVVQMRVAPWIMFGNTTPIDTIYANTPSPVFVNGLQTSIDATPGVNFHKITNWTDHWTEDYFQTGFVSIPAKDGQVIGMRVAIPRPWGRQNSDSALPLRWLEHNHLAADMGYVQVYTKAHTGSTFDSHGNHELVPAYSHDGQDFPFGRIIHGDHILKETKAFYDAQVIQGPSLVLNTAWLIVGHIDEVFTYIPADNERGWKLIVGSPRLAKEMLEQWAADGHEEAVMFEGKNWLDRPAAVTIAETLANEDIMHWSQEAQAEIDSMVAKFKAETGITDDDIVELPFLFDAENYPGAGWLKVAYNPGTTNLRYFNGTGAVPDPFGPKIDGVDGFKKDIEDRLGTGAEGLGVDGQGLKLFFVDDWDLYHRLLGEVHCGSNYSGPPQAEITWWEHMQ